MRSRRISPRTLNERLRQCEYHRQFAALRPYRVGWHVSRNPPTYEFSNWPAASTWQVAEVYPGSRVTTESEIELHVALVKGGDVFDDTWQDLQAAIFQELIS